MMKKATAIRLLGGTQVLAASEIGITQGAVARWPDPLPKKTADRVIAALARRYLRPELIGLAPNVLMDSPESTAVGTLIPDRVSSGVSTE